MEQKDCPITLETFAVKLIELEKRMLLQKENADKALDKAALELKEKLLEMNEFRKENRDNTAKFALVATLDERVEMLHVKIDALHKTMDDGLGARVNILELYRANLDGRFWVWGVFITVLTLILQFWPLLKGK